MKMPRKRIILLVPLALFALVYIGAAVMLALRDDRIAVLEKPATGTKRSRFSVPAERRGRDSKAALASPDIQQIHVITRRTTPRIEQGVAAGRCVTLHRGLSRLLGDRGSDSRGGCGLLGARNQLSRRRRKNLRHDSCRLSRKLCGEVAQCQDKPAISFHYISSSDISEDSTAMWAREKVRAERTLFKLAEGTNCG